MTCTRERVCVCVLVGLGGGGEGSDLGSTGFKRVY